MDEAGLRRKLYKQILVFTVGIVTGGLAFGTYMKVGSNCESYIGKTATLAPITTTQADNLTTTRKIGQICTPAYVRLIGSNVTFRTEDFFEKMSMKRRLEYVQAQCAIRKRWMNHTDVKVPGQQKFFVDKNQSVIICDLHKVGSHQLAGILQHVNNQTGNLFAYRDKILRNLTVRQANRSPYRKVMFIRDPMERLLSAYINNRAVRYVNQSKVSFQTFLQDILDTPVYKLNLHHQRFYDICQPCKIRYQVIGTLSTFQNDISLVFNKAGFNRTDHLHNNVRVGRNYLESYFMRVSQSVIHKIWELFRMDYYLFGFPYPHHLMNVSLIPMFNV